MWQPDSPTVQFKICKNCLKLVERFKFGLPTEISNQILSASRRSAQLHHQRAPAEVASPHPAPYRRPPAGVALLCTCGGRRSASGGVRRRGRRRLHDDIAEILRKGEGQLAAPGGACPVVVLRSPPPKAPVPLWSAARRSQGCPSRRGRPLAAPEGARPVVIRRSPLPGAPARRGPPLVAA